MDPQPNLPPPVAMSGWTTLLFAVACGASVANLYYAQPLAGLIGPEIGLSPDATGLVVTITQLGYAAGLILVVPLGDLLENRRLILVTVSATVLALLGVCLATSGPILLAAAALLGLTAVVTQMLVPFAAHLAPEARRGQVVGTVTGGLLLGILLARPAASFIADLFGWRAVFAAAAVLMVALGILLAATLPARRPGGAESYRGVIGSMPGLLWRSTPLRRRAAYQMTLFTAFSLFWMAIPLELAGPAFSFSQRDIGLFALAGAAGALAAPLAGHLADRGHGRLATGIGLLAAALAFVAAHLGQSSVWALAAAAILLDSGAQISMVVGQRTIFTMDAGMRSRLNGIYMACFFAAGAAGSAVAGPLMARAGWSGVAALGFALPVLALVLYATEFRAGTTR